MELKKIAFVGVFLLLLSFSVVMPLRASAATELSSEQLAAASVSFAQNSELFEAFLENFRTLFVYAQSSSGLMGHWSFDEGSGTTAADSSGNGNDGTLTNGPTWTTGQIDGALSFDGVDDEVVIGDIADYKFEVTDDFSISLWLLRNDGEVTQQDILYKYSNTQGGYRLYIHPAHNGRIQWQLSDGHEGNGINFLIATHSCGQCLNQTWNHIVGTYSASASTTALYLNGSLVDSGSSTLLDNIDNTQSLRIGNGQWPGHIDDARIYNRTLSASEVADMHNAGSGGSPPPPPPPSSNTVFFVRPAGGSYGAENGLSYSNAWNGFANIDWSQLGAGDTLYFSGTFTNNLEVYSGGSATQDLWIRGDHSLRAGIINNADILWSDSDSNYITVYGITINEGRIYNKQVAAHRRGTDLLFIAPNIIRDPDKGFSIRNFQPGQMLRMSGGSTSANRWSYLIRSITDEGAYEEVTLETVEATHSIRAEGPGTKNIEAIWPNHHITIDNSYIQSSQNWREVVTFTGTDITIRNSELDGSGTTNRAGVLYTNGRAFWKLHAGIVIENNYIHGGSISSDSDEHCIGIQGTDGVIITRNRIADCASGIVLWHGSNTAIKNYEITYNLIEDMDFTRNPISWGGSGIVYTGSNTIPPDNTSGIVAGNIIRNPLNCPHGGQYEWGACLGIRTKNTKTMSIYNNIVVDHDRSIVVRGASPAGDVKNNIVMNSGLEHIYSLAPGTFYEEDYNIYNPDGNTSFVYANRNYNFADYNNTHAVTVNQHSLIADPSLDANYRPDSASDPVVNAGVNVGYRHLVSASWPTGPGGGSFTFATDETPDIGVFTFGLSGNSTPPLPPTELRVIDN